MQSKRIQKKPSEKKGKASGAGKTGPNPNKKGKIKMNTEITTAKYDDLKFKLYCMVNTERRNNLTARLMKSVSDNNIKEFILVKQAITEELKNEKAGVSEERFDKLSAKINKIKDEFKRYHLQTRLEESFLYDNTDWFNSVAKDTEETIIKEK